MALSSPTAQQPGAHIVFVVQGDMGNPAHLRAGMLTEQAVKTPFEELLEQFDVAAHEQEQRNHQTSGSLKMTACSMTCRLRPPA